MPDTPLIASSIGSMTDEEISSGLAPGSTSDTLIVAGSARGKRSTPRLLNEKIPVTTSDMTSIVAKTGRRTQSSDNIWLLRLRSDGDLQAVDQFVDIGHRHGLAGLHAAHDFDSLAETFADFELFGDEMIAVDDEHAIDAVPVLKRRIRQCEDGVTLVGLHLDAGKRPRLQQRIGVRHKR